MFITVSPLFVTFIVLLYVSALIAFIIYFHKRDFDKAVKILFKSSLLVVASMSLLNIANQVNENTIYNKLQESGISVERSSIPFTAIKQDKVEIKVDESNRIVFFLE